MADKLTWLEEVKADAKFNYLQRLREQEEKRKHEQSKAQSAEVKPTQEKKGK